ncbi:MAG: sulfatase-like hydrolase/transferase [Verrucomicrobiales bacterium]|nr:sulfatase-like hydrolase/transferase [Verrucomicrobiales bacterium]
MKFFTLFPLLWFAAALCSGAEKPNVLLIFSDDQGWNDVGCYGSEIPTPNIDRIAAEGVRFDQFYSASSICTPSRFGLLTGRNPSRSEDELLSALMFMADEHKTNSIKADETTIASWLRSKAGYETALIGKWHLGHGSVDLLPPNRGFDFFRGHTGGCIDFFTMTYGIIPDWYHGTELKSENGYATELITEEAVNYIGKSKDSDKPFFLYLAYNAPHFGKGYSPADEKPVNLMQPQAADLKRVDSIEDKIRREFAAMTVSLDDGVGKVLDALDQNGISEDTLVIFLTDHGGDPTYGGSNTPLRGQKATLFEGGIKVPCVMRWPGKITKGSVVKNPYWAIDLFPTFSELGGISETAPLTDGSSFAGLLRGGAVESPEREFFWETGQHSELNRKGWAALRRGDLKYVNSPQEGEFLFDLSQDPNEETDLKAEKPEEFETLKTRWEKLAKEYRE